MKCNSLLCPWRAYIGVFFCFFAYLMLSPARGPGVIDASLFAGCGTSTLRSILLLQLLIGFALLDTAQHDSSFSDETRRMSKLLVVFSLLVYAQSFRVGSISGSLVAANMCLCTSSFLLCYVFRQKSNAFDTFPLVIIAILSVYSALLIRATLVGGAARGDAVYHFGDITRLSVIFDHPNHLGNFLAFGLVFCFSCAVFSPRRWTTPLIWATLFVLTFGLIRTYSRGAWLGCSVGLSICLYHMRKRIASRELLRSAGTLVFVLVMAVVFSSTLQNVSGRIYGSTSSSDDSVGNRTQVWRGAFRMIRDHWLFGVGIARFGDALDDGYKPKHIQRESYSSALNNYLTLAAEAGIPALIVYLWAITCACATATRGIERTGPAAGTQIGMLCGVFSMLVFGLTTYTLGRVHSNVLVWSILGYLAASHDAHVDCSCKADRIGPKKRCSLRSVLHLK